MTLEEPRLTLSDFTWASAAQLIQWLEVNCRLEPVNLNSIWSMRATRKTGFRGLLSRKIKLEETLRRNRDALEMFSLEENLTLKQVDVVSSFVGNIDMALAVIADQIKALERIVNYEQKTIVLEYSNDPEDVGEIYPEIPF